MLQFFYFLKGQKIKLAYESLYLGRREAQNQSQTIKVQETLINNHIF
jgi:hypothetical protein